MNEKKDVVAERYREEFPLFVKGRLHAISRQRINLP